MLNSYRELKVWQRSIDLTIAVYQLVNFFPKSELYCLSSQMRRSAISIASNIAEGYTRGHRLEYLQFLRIAFGSGAELETQIIIARKLKFAAENELSVVDSLLSEVMKMLNKLIVTLNPKP